MRPTKIYIDPATSINWQMIKNLLPYLVEFKGRVLFAVVFMVMAKLSTILMPFFLKEVVDILSTGSSTNDSKLALTAPTWLLVPVALVAAYGFLRFTAVFFGEIRDTLFSKVTERAMRRVGLKVFQHLHNLDIDFHLNRRTGGLSRDIERGTHGISFLMRFLVFNIVPTLIEISLVIVILLLKLQKNGPERSVFFGPENFKIFGPSGPFFKSMPSFIKSSLLINIDIYNQI